MCALGNFPGCSLWLPGGPCVNLMAQQVELARESNLAAKSRLCVIVWSSTPYATLMSAQSCGTRCGIRVQEEWHRLSSIVIHLSSGDNELLTSCSLWSDESMPHRNAHPMVASFPILSYDVKISEYLKRIPAMKAACWGVRRCVCRWRVRAETCG